MASAATKQMSKKKKNKGKGAGGKGSKGKGAGGKRPAVPAASKADKYVLYQQAVQCVEAEIDFVDDTFKEIRGRRAVSLREDFCGTANTSCEWVKRRPANTAVGVDLDPEPLDWGRAHNIVKLKAGQDRITLLQENVLTAETGQVDCVLAMNFSYFILDTRDMMREYFETIRETLNDEGVLFLDCYGGSESFDVCTDEREINDSFSYIWDQADYDPMSGHMSCFIHFHFADGSKMDKAFSYSWRMWTMPEIRELLDEAGFSKVTVYLEGTDEETDEGDGDFQPAERGEADPAWIAYIVAEK